MTLFFTLWRMSRKGILSCSQRHLPGCTVNIYQLSWVWAWWASWLTTTTLIIMFQMGVWRNAYLKSHLWRDWPCHNRPSIFTLTTHITRLFPILSLAASSRSVYFTYPRPISIRVRTYIWKFAKAEAAGACSSRDAMFVLMIINSKQLKDALGQFWVWVKKSRVHHDFEINTFWLSVLAKRLKIQDRSR